jgi:Lon protease-like protein
VPPATPMFPLGSVLVPGMVLPLHVFEPRYRALVRDCLAGDREFGVVLIERGSEVGGGDVRTDVGTMARILQVDETPDGRFAVGAVGVRRIRVDAWLDDDPYPRAEISDWPEPDAPDRVDDPGDAGDPGGGDVRELIAACAALLRRTAALQAELGEPAPPLDLELAEAPLVAGYQGTALAPVGPMDRQELLAAPSVRARLERLHALLTDAVELLEARLGSG